MEMTVERARARYATKLCPRCGARLYGDMDVCYDCLYDFTRGGASRASAAAPGSAHAERGIPENPAVSTAAAAVAVTASASTAAAPAVVPAAPAAHAATPTSSAGGERNPSRQTRDKPSGLGDTQSLAPPPEALQRVGEEVGMLIRTPMVDAWLPVSPKEGCSLGRDPANDIVLHAPTVSRRHLRLAPTPDGMQVIDLGSTNPATYRGEEVRESVIVPYGDSIELCGCVLTMTGPEPTLG